VWNLTRHYWYHFLSLIRSCAFMMWAFRRCCRVLGDVFRSSPFSAQRHSLFSYDLFRGKGRIADLIFKSLWSKAMEGGFHRRAHVAAPAPAPASSSAW